MQIERSIRTDKPDTVIRDNENRTWLASSGPVKQTCQYLKRDDAVNSERFVTTLNKLKEQEDQSSSQLPYSLTLPPADFHIFFGSLNYAPRGRLFAENDELKHSAREELRRFSIRLLRYRHAASLSKVGKVCW